MAIAALFPLSLFAFGRTLISFFMFSCRFHVLSRSAFRLPFPSFKLLVSQLRLRPERKYKLLFTAVEFMTLAVAMSQ
jgi:hypothetical protein